MFNRAINASLIGAVMAFGLALSGQALADLTAAEAAELDAEAKAKAKATVSQFLADTKGAEAVLADAKGVLVCPKIRKGGFTIGLEGASAC
jgi:lipid-binding SYLF domain-containing protein